jgi:hypothetical protein
MSTPQALVDLPAFARERAALHEESSEVNIKSSCPTSNWQDEPPLHEQPLPETVEARAPHDDSTDAQRRESGDAAKWKQDLADLTKHLQQGPQKGHMLIHSFDNVRPEKTVTPPTVNRLGA